ncbi:tRNA (guanine26-N2/guanine27-N2)-dimethyltransferase [Nematocida ausubeli]|nr:tRNA (guanine26-N2/guanine27-N2)-dimethyltransferase [Nematocida ausubeli]KAI5135472.1 tRNA (guanine26-N2/guanine27-N2)-dimethyltransferase [Nematocida ausubeli]
MDTDAKSFGTIEENGTVIEGGAFYNPAQKFNRSLTIQIINSYIKTSAKEGIVLLECMSATGLRGIRYVKELRGKNTIVMNDISTAACNNIVANCIANGIPADLSKPVSSENGTVEVQNEDCRSLMLCRKKVFDVIDIDPFGTCSPYIETALEGIADGGLLCVTSTDTKVLFDKPPESCYKYYGSVSMNNSYSHELAVRVILSYISRSAAKAGMYIEPLVSMSMDFFIRVFVRVGRSKQKSNHCLLQNSQYFLCACLNRQALPILQKDSTKEAYRHVKIAASTECRMCKRHLGLYGPFWTGPLHDKSFLQEVINSIPKADIESKTGGIKESAHTPTQINRRIHGMLSMARDEIDTIFYHFIPAISSVLSFPVPPLPQIISFLHAHDIKVSLTHCKPNSIKATGDIEYVYAAVILYYRSVKPEIYALYEDRLTGKRQDIDRNTHNLMVYMNAYIEENGLKGKFEVDDEAIEITSKKYLKFQDKSGLGWGPMKR